MPEPGAPRRFPSIASKVLVFSICSYLVLTACILVAWNLGAPRLGVPGRVPELLGLEEDHIRSSLADKVAYLETWLSARRADAQGLSRIDSANPSIGALAAARRPDQALDGVRRELEARYEALCEGSTALSRILILRAEDGLVLVDSSRSAEGSVLPLAESRYGESAGQARQTDEILSFSAARAANGTAILFVLVAPMTSLLDELRDDRFDFEKGLGFAIADSEGSLIFPLAIPDSRLHFSAGEIPIVKAELGRMSAGRGSIFLAPLLELMSAGAARIGLSANEEMYVIAAAARNKMIGRIVSDSAAMAFLALLLAASASFLAYRHIKGILSPLVRLNAAVEAFGRSESFALPEDAPGEVGKITRAFAGLAQRVGAWKSDLEAEVEARTRMLRVTAELCEIFARDASEKVSVATSDVLKKSFWADAAAIFYITIQKEYRYCLAGTDFPIALPEDRWRACVKPISGEAVIVRFGPWSLPGLETPLSSWMSYRLSSEESESRHIFLGRAKGDWSDDEAADLVNIARTIAPILQIRRERSIEEHVRQEAEEKLAGNERRLRTFLEGSRDMIYTADSADVVTDINAAGVALLRRSEKSEIVGKPYSSFALSPEDRGLLLRRVREVGYAADYEIVLKREDGVGLFCLETAYAIRDAAGDVVELQGIVKDISERISSESALWRTNIELADANVKIQKTQALMIQHEKLASIGQLAAGIAHEINNPLGFLKSNHEMIEKYMRRIKEAWGEAKSVSAAEIEEIERRRDLAYLFAEIDKMLGESDEGFGRIMHIVGNLKSFSRVEQGTGSQLYNVNAGIESTLVVARNEIKYVADVKEELGELPQIRAKGNEINQVILNILVNAAQAIEGQKRKEKGLIEIRTAVSGDRVVLEIRDDGPGIPESLRTRIFDPFFTTKEPGKGTGLGLSISYDIIVTKHGGRLSVDSTPGKGSVFTIELPIAGIPTADAE